MPLVVDPNESSPFVSVIVPTYRDWDALARCLRALAGQTYRPDRFEILVVNNDPDTPAPEQLCWPANARLLLEPQPGSYAARNKALSEVKGTVIAFTDSDCLPHSEWITRAVEHLLAGHERVAGRVRLFCESPRRTLTEAHELVFAFDQPKLVRAGASVTANLVTWKSAFEKVGEFDSRLYSGGDMDWGYRATRHGLDIVYAPDVVVDHPARSRLSQLLGKQRRVLGAVATLQEYSKERWWLVRAVLPPLKAVGRIARSPDLSLPQKCGVFWISYLLKLTGAYYRASILLGLSVARRS